ncbi:hypothetical protein HZS_6435 [Henneguya salminicola]|nr:hypothetical protein HZS_6435 [Henneguya salminicola]
MIQISPPLAILYQHDTVNHSVNFIDARTGPHTNTIKGTWNALKIKISPRNRTDSYDEERNLIKNYLDYFIREFLWRRRHSNQTEKNIKPFQKAKFTFKNSTISYRCHAHSEILEFSEKLINILQKR